MAVIDLKSSLLVSGRAESAHLLDIGPQSGGLQLEHLSTCRLICEWETMCQFYRTSVLPRLQQEVNSSQITLSKIQFLKICVPGNFNGNPGVDRWSVEHLSALKQNPT